MMARTHRLVNVAGATVLITLTTPPVGAAVIWFAGTVANSSTPDIDQKLPLISHRGATSHSWLTVVGFGLLTGYLAYRLPDLAVWAGLTDPFWLWTPRALADQHVTVGAACAYGILLHELADAPTKSGIPFFWPFIRRDVHLLPEPVRVRVNSNVEKALYAIIALTFAYFLYDQFNQPIREWLNDH